MSPHQLFATANGFAMLAWVGLLAFPRHRWSVDVVGARLLPAAFAVAYAVIVAARWSGAEGGFGSLADVARLFSDPWLLLAGWLHYLAFDLFVGSWQARDARETGVPYLLLAPCLVLTFLFGPAGWVLYLVVRTRTRHRGTAVQNPA